MSWWALVVSAISTITCMILTINSKRQQRLDSNWENAKMEARRRMLRKLGNNPDEENKEDCGDIVNDVAANTQEGFWDGFIKDLDEQMKLLPEKKYYGAYRTSDVKIIPRNEKSHRYSIVPTNQKTRRRPRQQTKRR